MKKAAYKDNLRSIWRERKRFLSLLVITMLGVVMLTGLRAACVDLRESADRFYDSQNLFDLSAVSSMGLVKEDLDALQEVDGVERAEGVYGETVYTNVSEQERSVTLETFAAHCNQPYVLEGTLPAKSQELAVTAKFLKDSGKVIGDKITVRQEEQKGILKDTEFVITASIVDPKDVNSSEGAVSYRGSSSTDYNFYVPREAVSSPVYTTIYVLLDDTRSLFCYSSEYEDRVEEVMDRIQEEVVEDREKQTGSQWYLQDRSALSGYNNIKSDASAIESIGTAFPIVFFLVAVLISLTTITRMVEEERGLIGVYKALGYSRRAIRRKYLFYAFFACFLGGILGDLGGFIVLPEIVFTIFQTMYLLPYYDLQFDLLYGLGSVALFALGIVGATLAACHHEMIHTPAALIRPKAPRAGSRVLLERWTSLWSRLSFLNKVTVRNLFRYKKRLLMTVGGIMGCTALVLCGLTIRDSVQDLMPRQYEQINRYDLMVTAASGENKNLMKYIQQEDAITDHLNVMLSSVKLINKDHKEETLQLMVIPEGQDLEPYIHLENRDQEQVKLGDQGVLVTRNAASILDFQAGDELSLRDLNLKTKQIYVDEVVQNYLGNLVFMTQTYYTKLFGKMEPNCVLAKLSASQLSGSGENSQESASDSIEIANNLGKKSGIISSISVQELKDDFSVAFSMINMVVYIIIIMAAGLAFVVLFTLSNTNISERVRELSTIKVLGFFNGEVHQYVNKETLLLTALGIALGLPVGSAMGHALTYVLDMPSIYFAVSIHPLSYVLAAVISFAFAVIVDLLTNRVLDQINPVEALKSVE